MVVHDDSGHLDPVEVAEHAEGLLAVKRAAAVDAHLSSCARCQAVAASVGAVSARLAAEPRELAIPAAVAARIDAALADEAAARAPASGVRERRPGFVERFLRPLRERLPALAAAAASIAVLGIIGYTVVNDGFPSGGDDTAAETVADAAGSDEPDEAAQAPMDADEDAAEESDERADLDLGDDSVAAEDGESAADDELTTLNEQAVSPDERSALAAQLQDIVTGRAAEPASGGDGEACGTELAESLGQELIGAAETDLVEPGSILVAIGSNDPDAVEGWLLPGCATGVEDALLNFTAPRSE